MSGREALSAALERWDGAADPDAALAVLDTAAAWADAPPASEADRALWRRWLETTGEQPYLAALPDRAARHRWADVMFSALRHADFGLHALLDWRVRTRPDTVYLHDLGQAGEPALTYARTARRCRRIAAHLLGPAAGAAPPPRVAILAANGLEGALCDLACLTHDIPVAPLNVQEDTATLAWILDRLGTSDVIVDGPDRLQRALEVREQAQGSFRIHVLQPGGGRREHSVHELDAELADLAPEEVDRRLAGRHRLHLDDPCTVLFTSGSTGRPKGIVFTPMNLVSKRFARAAALPDVGREAETLLAFLPLYHTFGRYLELMGMLYWGGTYAFAGNPSLDTLLAGMQKVRPTGLISVPLRWQQIRERASEHGGDRDALAAVTGGRLRWGLSAAGWLAPDTFRWFHARGVALCSGFGMTEGTGGLTMTPPGEYVAGSVGLPLPGVRTRLGDHDELQVAGPYVARYLPADGPPGDWSVEDPGRDDWWLGTGDLFRELPGGHLQIVDRIKDIYKNNRGQTVAPRKVESRFAGVPGVARTFLAGDGRPYNVLLIVPDRQDPVVRELGEAEFEEYLRRVVRQANLDLAPYERVLSFAVLDRDFSADAGELTPKGSYRRKAIAENFQDVLAELYRRRTLHVGERELVIPDWVLRELGLLEDEIQLRDGALCNTRTGQRLALGPGRREGWLRIGDLEYRTVGARRTLDLGVLARHPLLWAGNAALQAFLPCRAGWDTRLRGLAEQVLLPRREEEAAEALCPPRREDRLGQLDEVIRAALFGDRQAAMPAVASLERRLPEATGREAVLIRRRLEALACHPLLEVRCEAYRILVMDQPEPDYGRYLPAFVDSEQPFLCPDSIAAIARSAGEPRRLLSFRRRLHAYREQLEWPASGAVRAIFQDLLRLLVDFARHQPDAVGTVRRELFCWVLFREDPGLADHARELARELTAHHHERLESLRAPATAWRDKVAFQDGLEPEEIARLRGVLEGTTFLAESAALALGTRLDPADLPAAGIWISRTMAHPHPARYRMSINTSGGRHFDLLLILRDDLDDPDVAETFMRVAQIRAWPDDTPVLPRLGAVRPDLGAASLVYTSGLTVWERIRQHAASTADVEAFGAPAWRRLLVAAMATVLVAWRHSGRQVVPGMVAPSNVVVPGRDWQRDRQLISLAGWRPYRDPGQLVRPLLLNFLRLPVSHYPALRGVVQDGWLAEAYAEALGPQAGRQLLQETAAALEREPRDGVGPHVAVSLRRFADRLATSYRPTLAVEGAAARYGRWREVNPEASARARSDQLESLIRLYHLDQEGEIARFALFRASYLREAPEAARDACDQLVDRLFRHPDVRAARTIELSDLQDALPASEDRAALARLAFPQSALGHRPEVAPVGDRARGHVVLQTEITDDRGARYHVREPRDASEMGRLYRMFLQAGFPLEISEADHHLVAVDQDNQLCGGVVWRTDLAGEPHLDGVVVSESLRGRGLARVLIADLGRRLADEDHTILRTHFSLQGFFQRLGFSVDRQRGGLVRSLG